MASQLAMHLPDFIATKWSVSAYGLPEAHVLIERLLSPGRRKASQPLAAEFVKAEERQCREGPEARLLVGRDHCAWKRSDFNGTK
jgi:hypothetical protein